MLPMAFGTTGSGPLTLLCLGAHSDDLEIGCGGTVLRLLSERPGSSVHWIVFSATPERETEARASAADFLAQAGERRVVVKSFKESYFPYVATSIKDFFEELKQSVQPDLVFCHRRLDMHQDHRLIAELAWNTFRNHSVLEFEIPKYEGDLGHPNLFVPLSRSVADLKVELILRHFASQANRAWFRPDTFHGLMSVRAVECNASEGRAEAFYAPKLIV
jgi:LmbE family N-acetylglucosaminyl deacetylase